MLREYLKLIRVKNGILFILAIILGGYVHEIELIKISIISLLYFCALSQVNVFNDVFDIQTDRINRSNRPLSSGKVSLINAKRLGMLLTIGFVLFSSFLGMEYMILAILVTILNRLYTSIMKPRVFMGNIYVSLMLASLFVLYAILSVEKPIVGYYLCVGTFLLMIAREILKDVEDIDGDKVVGMKTLPIVFGKDNAVFVSIIPLVNLGMVTAFFTYLAYPGGVNTTFLSLFILFGLFCLLCVSFTYPGYYTERRRRYISMLSLSMKILAIPLMVITPLFKIFSF